MAVDRPVCCALQHTALLCPLSSHCVHGDPDSSGLPFHVAPSLSSQPPPTTVRVFCKTLCFEISFLLVLSLITILSKRQRRIKQHLIVFAPSLVCFNLTTLIPWHSLFSLRSLHLLICELPNPLSSARLWSSISGDSRRGGHHPVLSDLDLGIVSYGVYGISAALSGSRYSNSILSTKR